MPNFVYNDITNIEYNINHINIIPQICNNIGKYGAGLSGALASKWPKVQDEYFNWYSGTGSGTSGKFCLDEIQFVGVDKHIAVINMIAQNGVRDRYNNKPICYPSLEMCLIKLFGSLYKIVPRFKWKKIMIWCPMIGSGFAGGDWSIIEEKISHWFDRPEFVLTYVNLKN